MMMLMIFMFHMGRMMIEIFPGNEKSSQKFFFCFLTIKSNTKELKMQKCQFKYYFCFTWNVIEKQKKLRFISQESIHQHQTTYSNHKPYVFIDFVFSPGTNRSNNNNNNKRTFEIHMKSTPPSTSKQKNDYHMTTIIIFLKILNFFWAKQKPIITSYYYYYFSFLAFLGTNTHTVILELFCSGLAHYGY